VQISMEPMFWNQLNNLKDLVYRKYLLYPRAIRSFMAMQQKHINSGCRQIDVTLIVIKGYELGSKLEQFAIDEI